MVSFLYLLNSEGHEFLILIKSNLAVFFSFIDHTFGVLPKKSLPCLCSQRFSYVFFLKFYTVGS